MRALPFALVVGLTFVAGAGAQGEAPDLEQARRDERARILFQAGRVHFEAGQYERALPEFEEAHALSGRDALLYNIAVTRERMGALRGALDAFDAFVAAEIEVPGLPRERLLRRVEALRERVVAGEEDEAPPPEEPAAAPSTGPPIGPIVLFGVAGASLLGALVVGGMALGEDSTLRDTCAPACTDDDLSSIRTLRVLADVLFGVSLASAIGALLWTLLADEDEDRDDVALAPWFAPTGGGVILRGSL
jgi:tetratricopeptide (TPR) repeat protein